MTVQDLLGRLEEVKPSGEGWKARCPAHEDTHASLKVSEGKAGRILLHCHAGCPFTAIVDALGVDEAALFPTREELRVHLNGKRNGKGRGEVEAVYDYQDASGALLHQTVRYTSKQFRQRRPDGSGGWIWSLKDCQTVLYHLPQLRQAIAAKRPVFVVEGEKDVHTLESFGLTATTNPMGAGHWDVFYNTLLAGASIVWLCDNDEPGRKHRERAAAQVHPKAENIRFLDLPGLGDKGDVTDWFTAGGTYDMFTRLVREAPIWTPPERAGLPEIQTNDRPLRDIAADALRALEGSNLPPRLFVRAGLLVRVKSDENGRPIVESVTLAQARGYLTRAADFLHVTGRGQRHVTPAEAVVADVLAMGGWPMPPLDTISETPLLRPDGTLLVTPGYDPATRMFYAPAAGLSFPPIPMAPSREEVTKALALLEDLFGEFPYVDAASRANMLGLLLTPILRSAITGPTPLALIDAPQRGTGKSLLAELVSIVATGRPAAMLSAPEGNEEWRKSLTATFREAAAIITIDNVEGRLDAAALALALTVSVWKDRILGASETFEFPVRCTWIATGNNITPGGDIPRRCTWIRLDAQMARPWQRTEFRHPNAREWALANRGRLVAALLTIARHWFAQGCPPAEVPMMGSFESWSRTVGSVLAAAGVTGFLGNLDAMYDSIDTDDQQWEVFLTEWREVYGDAPKRVTEVAANLRATIHRPGSAFEPDDTYLRLREAIPDDAKIDVEGSEDSLRKRLGWALKKKVGVRHGPDGLCIVKADTDKHAKVEQWRVVAATPSNQPRA